MDILRFPLVRFTLFFASGIVWAYQTEPAPRLLSIASTSCFIILFLCYLKARHFRKLAVFGIVLASSGFFCGALTQAVHSYYNQRDHYIGYASIEKESRTELVISERLKNGSTGTRYFALVNAIDGKKVTGKVLLHFKNRARFCIGSKLIASGKIVKNRQPLNPSQFDYGRYLNDKSVPAQLYLNRNYRVYGVEKNIGHYADRLRIKMIGTLRQNGFREPELQVLHALILGQQQEISPEIVKDYQFAGAVHILSVSGLHVGFVLIFINFALRRLPKTRRWNYIRLGIVLISLWSFALIAGLSPSVVRSATMFSFVSIGMNLRRSTNTFHTLIVSLLLILLIEPSFIVDVGFQLSYAALFFILWLQPLFSTIWTPKNSIINYFWDILTVSFAAQIGTLPLSIYYFHQFPALFFLTNLIVIPVLSVIMSLGIVVMIPSAFGYALPILTELLEWGILTLNRLIKGIASYEDFVLTDIPFNFALMPLAYAVIIALVIWWRKPSGIRMVSAIAVAFVCQFTLLTTLWTNKTRSEFIVFDVSKKTLIADRKGKTLSAFGESRRVISSYAVANFISTIEEFPLRNTYWFDGKKILVINSGLSTLTIKPDIVVMSQSPKINLDRWLLNHQPEMIVADASNYKTDVARWKATCRKRKIPFHYTREKGFFRLSNTIRTSFVR